DPAFQRSLTRAGHHVEVAKDAAHLDQALQTGGMSLILWDADGIETIAAAAERSKSSPELVPVIDKLPKDRAEAISSHFPTEVKLSDRPARYLGTIEQELQARAK